MSATLPTDVQRPRGRRFPSGWWERSGGWIGIDVGTEAIKIARVTRQREGWNLALSRLLAVPQDIPVDSASVAEGLISQLIATHLPPAIRSGCRQTACVLPMSIVELQAVELPPGSDRELRQMIAVELEGRSATPGGGREFEYCQGLTPNGGSTELRSLNVFSVESATAGGLASHLWSAGLHCEVLETIPCALARAVQLVDPRGARGNVAALDWGATTPTLSVISQGRPIFTRILRDCGVRAYAERGAGHFGCSPAEFHELISACAATVDGHEELKTELSQLANPLIEQLISELHKTLAYLKQQSMDPLPQRVWLLGGGGLIPGIAPRLSHLLGLEVRSWQLSGSGPRPWQTQFGAAIALSALGAKP